MTNTETLKESLVVSGLTAKEADIYLACSRLGPSCTLEISRETRLPRTTIYTIAEKLLHRGLISKILKGGSVKFFVQNQEKLLEQARKRFDAVRTILPDLKEFSKSAGKKPKIRYYEGIEQVRELYWDILKTPRLKSYEVLSSTPQFLALGKSFAYSFMRERAKKGIVTRIIAKDSREIRELKSSENRLLFKVKIVPDKLFPELTSFLIVLPSSVVFVGTKTWFAVSIESKEVRDPLKIFFDLLWYSGLDMEV